MREQPSEDEDRDDVIAAREHWPLSRPRHIGTWIIDDAEQPCMCENCRRFLCGTRLSGLKDKAEDDPSAEHYVWHIRYVLRSPAAFIDEPFCPQCFRELAATKASRADDLTVALQALSRIISPQSLSAAKGVIEALARKDEEGGNAHGYWQGAQADRDRPAAGADPAEDDLSEGAGSGATAGAREGAFVGVPDSITPVVGWRAWRIGDDGALLSLMNSQRWPAGRALRATCTSRGGHPRTGCSCPQDPAPARTCRCGVYAVMRLKDVPGRGPNEVIGRVALWGRVVPGDDGWRGEYAYPQAFYVDPDQLARFRPALAPFGVPILSTVDLPAPDQTVSPNDGRSARRHEGPVRTLTCRDCSREFVAFARRRSCDECLVINGQRSSMRTALKAATACHLPELIASIEHALLALEAQRPRAST